MENLIMDKAGQEAETDLLAMIVNGVISPVAVKVIANWVTNNYLDAGYKRLCQVLIKLDKGGII